MPWHGSMDDTYNVVRKAILVILLEAGARTGKGFL